MPATPALLFDLGGVLIDNDLFAMLDRLLPARASPQGLRSRWLESEAVAAFERGLCGPDAFAEAVVREWGLAIAPADFLRAFAGCVHGPYPGAVELLQRLGRSHAVAYLSNCNPAHWDRVAPLLPYARHAVFSHLCGLVKPDPAIFRRAVEVVGRPSGEIWFFDDSQRNVEAARAAGMQARLTVGFDALRTELRALGLPADPARA